MITNTEMKLNIYQINIYIYQIKAQKILENKNI